MSWKRTSRKAVNFVLSVGSVISLGTGVVYLWILPASKYIFWPHYMMLSFLIFALLMVLAVLISVLDPSPQVYVVDEKADVPVWTVTNQVKLSWTLLTLAMVALYIHFKWWKMYQVRWKT